MQQYLKGDSVLDIAFAYYYINMAKTGTAFAQCATGPQSS